jgi:CelD/BcsL family acetyltransferase involved in cellulose biosynthesis
MSVETQHESSIGVPNGVTVEVLRGSDALVRLKPVWNELLRASDANTVFLTWEWVAAWWSAYGSPFDLILLKCTDSAGSVVGVAPFFRVKETLGLRVPGYALYLLCDITGGSEKLDWIARDGSEEPVVKAVVDWLDSDTLDWDIFFYDTVRPESKVAKHLVAECGRRHWFQIRSERPTFRVPIAASFDTYLNSLSKKMRSGIQQQVRRANKTFAVRARRCETLEQLDDDLKTLFALHAKRWQERGKTGNLFQSDKQLFYNELAKSCLANGWLEFWMLEFDGKPVACEFGFCYDGIYSFLQGGFDPEFGVYSVGVVLRASIMQSLIERRFRVYDFLLGEDDYKERWGGERYPLADYAFARPKSKGHRLMVAKKNLESTIGWLRTHTPKPLWAIAKKAARSVRSK